MTNETQGAAAVSSSERVMRVCKICGDFEDEHHEPDWLEIPAGCVCDWREWNYETMAKIPPACEEYQGDGTHNCNRCEHDKECHQAPNAELCGQPPETPGGAQNKQSKNL